MKSMKSRLVLCAVVLGLLAAVPVIAMGPTGQAGNSNTGLLYLVKKDYTDPNWPPIPGAWGKMKYKLSASKFYFLFNGHGLTPGEDYTLIYYPDKDGNPWPREDIICLGSDRANEGGNVHIKGAEDTGDLPNPETDINEGAKIWLVLSDDINCAEATMFGWNPGEYLFEYDLITYSKPAD
ncbi:MAG: hypothetical protein ACYS4W_07755 [Planctomycetota bacterium]|jgi:hypothetical protein